MTRIAFYAAIEKLLESSPKFERRILTGLDFGYLDAWLDAGIAPESILEGIIRSLKRFRMDGRRRIHSVAYFQDEVFECHKNREKNKR